MTCCVEDSCSLIVRAGQAERARRSVEGAPLPRGGQNRLSYQVFVS
jgi:hypothetical protein